MFTTKENYLSPFAEIIEIKLEKGIMELSYGEEGAAGADQQYNRYNENF